MMTCGACCREFEAKKRSRYCPFCGFNNGRGWWPRRGDKNDRVKAERSRKRAGKERGRQTDAA